MITNGKNNSCNRHILSASFHNKYSTIRIIKGIVKHPASLTKSIIAQPIDIKNINNIM